MCVSRKAHDSSKIASVSDKKCLCQACHQKIKGKGWKVLLIKQWLFKIPLIVWGAFFLMSSMNLILFHLFSIDFVPAFSNRTIILDQDLWLFSYDALLQREKQKVPAGSLQCKFFMDLFEQNYLSGQRIRSYFIIYKCWSNFFCNNLLDKLLFSREKRRGILIKSQLKPVYDSVVLECIKEYLSSNHSCPVNSSIQCTHCKMRIRQKVLKTLKDFD